MTGISCIFFFPPKATGKTLTQSVKKKKKGENKTEYLQKLVTATLKQPGTLIPRQQPHGADVWLKGLQTS